LLRDTDELSLEHLFGMNVPSVVKISSHLIETRKPTVHSVGFLLSFKKIFLLTVKSKVG